ncbi:MAG: hypothetical protein AAFW46_14205 [Pseudomonadota bacterium]
MFVTSGGHEVRLPPISNLDCAEMKAVLTRIDQTGYRHGSPRPADDADMPLLRYEDALSAQIFEQCAQQGPARAYGGRALPFARSN